MTRVRVLFALLVCFVVVACSDAPRYRRDPLMDSVQRVEASNVIAKWNTVLVEPIAIDDRFGEWNMTIAPPVLLPDCPPGVCSACTHSSHELELPRTIQVSPAVRADAFYPALMHEVGHSLGLHHVSQGVMNPRTLETEFSAEDMEECRRRKRCW
jgi:hypothetical protein